MRNASSPASNALIFCVQGIAFKVESVASHVTVRFGHDADDTVQIAGILLVLPVERVVGLVERDAAIPVIPSFDGERAVMMWVPFLCLTGVLVLFPWFPFLSGVPVFPYAAGVGARVAVLCGVR